jgi:hypothetical protein
MATKTKKSTRDQLHQLIDELDDARAAALLTLLDREHYNAALLASAKPMTADDPLWKLADLIDPAIDVPSDVSSDIHRYVADAIESEWKD